jgi:hypothetical protein
MATQRNKAVAKLVEELEVKAARMRLTAKKFDRDLVILEALLAKKAGKALSPYIRKHINQRLQARTDAQNAVQELMQSQEFYLLRQKA